MKDVKTISEENKEKLAEKTCKAFIKELKNLLQDQDKVIVSLCGGKSVRKFYKKIPKHAKKLDQEDWENIHFFFTDERIVNPLDEGSNHKQARDLFLMDLGRMKLLLEENVHRFHGQKENINEELARYDDMLNELGGDIDIAIMGVGKDGHIGSLFPNKEELDAERKEYLLVTNSPKPPAERITIAPKHIEKSQTNFLFFIDEEKEKAYKKFQDEEADYHNWPCKLALKGEGTCYVSTNLA